MALEQSITDPWSVEHPGAYHKIVDFHCDYRSKHAAFSVEVFHSAAVREAGGLPLPITKVYECNDPAFTTYFGDALFANSNPRALGYSYLKTLADFQGAIDV